MLFARTTNTIARTRASPTLGPLRPENTLGAHGRKSQSLPSAQGKTGNLEGDTTWRREEASKAAIFVGNGKQQSLPLGAPQSGCEVKCDEVGSHLEHVPLASITAAMKESGFDEEENVLGWNTRAFFFNICLFFLTVLYSFDCHVFFLSLFAERHMDLMWIMVEIGQEESD